MKRCILLALLLLLLGGCKTKKNLPFYRFEVGNPSVLYADGARYLENTDIYQLQTYRPGRWSFTGKTGDAVGLCGGDSGYDVRVIEGDEERDFLYVIPNHFVFGPFYTYLCAREDVPVSPPSAETISYSSLLLTVGEEETELTDRELIAALLDFYFTGTGEEVSHYAAEEGMTLLTLVFSHRDYPFLTAEIKGCRNIETGASYLTCADEIRRELPPALAAQLS